MKYINVFLFLILIFISKSILAQEKLSIAVLSISGNGVSPTEALVLTDELISVLVQTGKFNVLERKNMEDILNEQGFQLSGCTSTDCAVEAGKLLGVKKMIAGSVGKLGKLFNVSLRSIDIETGKIDNTTSGRHEGSIEELLDIIRSLGIQLSHDNTVKSGEEIELTNYPVYRQRSINKKFGIKIGFNSTSTTNLSESGIGFFSGGLYRFFVNQKFIIQPEILYSSRKFKYDDPDEYMHFEVLQFALMASYNLLFYDNNLFIFNFNAGPAFNLLLSAHKEVDGYKHDLTEYNGSNQVEDNEIVLIFGPGFGINLDQFIINAGLQYEIGMTNLFKNDNEWEVGKSRVISIFVTILF